MAGEAQDTVWPLPKFSFSVDVGGTVIPFQEVSGLDVETEVIEYRAGNSKEFSKIKMPGLIKTSNITLKKGIFATDNGLYDWFSKLKMNTIERKDIIISLLDQDGNPTMVWNLTNAFPVKVQGTDLKAEGNEVAVESIEVAYEAMKIENG